MGKHRSPESILWSLRDMADSFAAVGRSASADGNGRASSRYGKRAAVLYAACELIEALQRGTNEQPKAAHAEEAAAGQGGDASRPIG